MDHRPDSMPAPMMSAPNTIHHDDAADEKLVERFAAWLGTQGSTSTESIESFVSYSVRSSNVVLTIPSLKMTTVTPPSPANNGPMPMSIMPDIGVSSLHRLSMSDEPMDEGTGSASPPPVMEASVLARTAIDDDSIQATDVIEQAAVSSMSEMADWTKSTVGYAAAAVATNVSTSFRSLIDSRVRTWTLLLLRHSLETGEGDSRTRLLRMLAADIRVTSTQTNFRTLPLPPAAIGQPKEADVILPLLFEVTLQITLQDKSSDGAAAVTAPLAPLANASGSTEHITIRAPGTISGTI
jgi:hypothetical protein